VRPAALVAALDGRFGRKRGLRRGRADSGATSAAGRTGPAGGLPSVSSSPGVYEAVWSRRRSDFELFISPVVIDEARKGDPALAKQRLNYLDTMTVLEVTPSARSLAADLLRLSGIPMKAKLDALHIATAAVGGMNYLLTWNCTHIANAEILPKVYEVCRDAGYEPPFVCTPLELLGASHD